jgi:hypothetical protein
MKVAVVYSVTATTAVGYSWRWCAADNGQKSAEEFVFYADCLADASRYGYTVEAVHPQGENAPARGFGNGLH